MELPPETRQVALETLREARTRLRAALERLAADRDDGSPPVFDSMWERAGRGDHLWDLVEVGNRISIAAGLLAVLCAGGRPNPKLEGLASEELIRAVQFTDKVSASLEDGRGA